MDLFQNLEPIKNLDNGQINDLISSAQHEELRKNQKLEAFDERNWFVYLVEGELKLRAPSEPEQRFRSDSQRAFQPLFSDANSHEIAVFTSKAMVVRIDRKRYTQLVETTEQVAVTDIQVGDVEAGIVRRLFRDYHADAIAVPSIPEVAMRVRELMDDPGVDHHQLAAAIESDPAMAGKLIAAANSALVRGRMEVCSVHEALVRMGLKTATNLVISAATRELFSFAEPNLRTVSREVWNHAVRVGAIARVLARHWGGTLLEQDKAFMLGLLHNIGAASLLAYFQQLAIPVSPAAIHATMDKLQSLVSTLVLEKWRMDEDFIAVAGECGDWLTTHHVDWVNLINLSSHQARVMVGEAVDLPPITELPGWGLLVTSANEVADNGLLELLSDHKEVVALTQLLDR